MKLNIQGQTCHLLPEKVVYWEEQKTLILSDIHIGKETVFRKAGIPIPQGIMQDDLSNITKLIYQWKAKKCIIVGDLIHSSEGLSEDVKEKFAHWLKNSDCEVHLIVGNHDRALVKNLPSEWSINIHTESLLIKPFYFSHFPLHHEKWFVWAGHIHPKIEIKDRHDSLVLRCFQIFDNLAILPAFGTFVGGAFVKKGPDCKIYAIADTHIIEI